MLPIQSLKSLGFTLIELLVVISIMGLVLAVSVPAYSRFQKQQATEQAGKELVSVLRLAQKKASAGEKPQAACTVFNGYIVSAAANASSYTLQAKCDNAAHADSAQTFFMNAQVKFTSAFAVTYSVVNMGIVQGATVDPASGEIEIRFATDYTYTVTVVPGTGSVKEGEVAALP